MNIKIYQINLKRDQNRVAFSGTEFLKTYQGNSEINSAIYDRVYEGVVDCADLEEVFQTFNLNHPEGYKGRSLSVSDIIEVIDDNGHSNFHFCDSIGFKDVAFNPELAEDYKEETLKVILCEPGKMARIAEVSNKLEDLQRMVAGYIEQFCPWEEPVAIICNEEAKINGMAPNRAIYDDGELLDVIFGPFFICDCSGESYGSLNQEQIARFMKQFEKPEQLMRVNGILMSVPYTPAQK